MKLAALLLTVSLLTACDSESTRRAAAAAERAAVAAEEVATLERDRLQHEKFEREYAASKARYREEAEQKAAALRECRREEEDARLTAETNQTIEEIQQNLRDAEDEQKTGALPPN